MRSAVFLLLCAVGYIAFIWWCISKLKDIADHPQKWEKIKGRERYLKSFWYESGNERYGKHYYAFLLISIPGFLLSILLYQLTGSMIQRYLLIPGQVQYLRSAGIIIGSIPAMFFSIGVEQFILFVVNRPMFVAARLYVSHSAHYAKAWRNTFLWLLVLGIICLPLMALGINACSYADEEKIVSRGFFTLAEKEIPYESIVSGETSYSADGEEFTFRYRIRLEDGTEFAISDFDNNGVIYIDTMLRQHGIPISRQSVDPLTYAYMKQVCGEKELKMAEAIFDLTQ